VDRLLLLSANTASSANRLQAGQPDISIWTTWWPMLWFQMASLPWRNQSALDAKMTNICMEWLRSLKTFIRQPYFTKEYQFNVAYNAEFCNIILSFSVTVCCAQRNLCIAKYGKAPEVSLGGNLSATFSYIPQLLDYILLEILKNALRYVCRCITLMLKFSCRTNLLHATFNVGWPLT